MVNVSCVELLVDGGNVPLLKPIKVLDGSGSKPVPVTVTTVPTGPKVGDILVIVGTRTVNVELNAVKPPTVTAIAPVVAPAGTDTVSWVVVATVTVATVLLNLTILFPAVALKLVPVMTTFIPTGPLIVESAEMAGEGRIVKAGPDAVLPFVVTMTVPVVVPVRTITVRLVAVAAVTVAAVPLIVTLLLAGVVLKLVPVIVTVPPTGPLVGEIPVTVGAGGRVIENPGPGIVLPFVVTSTVPDVVPVRTTTVRLVAVAVITVAGVPLIVTLLLAAGVLKLVPVIVTVVPTGPLVGEIAVTLGVSGVTS